MISGTRYSFTGVPLVINIKSILQLRISVNSIHYNIYILTNQPKFSASQSMSMIFLYSSSCDQCMYIYSSIFCHIFKKFFQPIIQRRKSYKIFFNNNINHIFKMMELHLKKKKYNLLFYNVKLNQFLMNFIINLQQ